MLNFFIRVKFPVSLFICDVHMYTCVVVLLLKTHIIRCKARSVNFINLWRSEIFTDCLTFLTRHTNFLNNHFLKIFPSIKKVVLLVYCFSHQQQPQIKFSSSLLKVYFNGTLLDYCSVFELKLMNLIVDKFNIIKLIWIKNIN